MPKEMKTTIRKAKMADVNQIKLLINKFADKGQMLHVSVNQLYEGLRNFWVIESRGKIIGCGALKVMWEDLAEIRSMAVLKRYQRKGYGGMLVSRLLEEAKELEIEKVFVLTYVPEFFRKFRFRKIAKSRLPHKVWNDCINCPKFPNCDEIAMLRTSTK
jgi:amino-acid N-acetyltransferase